MGDIINLFGEYLLHCFTIGYSKHAVNDILKIKIMFPANILF